MDRLIPFLLAKLLASILMCRASLSWSQASEFELSLESFLKIETEVPGINSVITREKKDTYGAFCLREVNESRSP